MGPKQQICGKVLFLRHGLLLVEQGIKPLAGQVMVLPIGNDMRQITQDFLGTRILLDLTLYNEAGNTKAKSLMDEAKKRGKENAR